MAKASDKANDIGILKNGFPTTTMIYSFVIIKPAKIYTGSL